MIWGEGGEGGTTWSICLRMTATSSDSANSAREDLSWCSIGAILT